MTHRPVDLSPSRISEPDCSITPQPTAHLPRGALLAATGRWLDRTLASPPFAGTNQEPHVERVGQSGNRPIQSSYEPNTCEPTAETSPNEPTASCPDGSNAYGDGVCATTGLKGPPTAAQQFIANLSNESPATVSPTQANSTEAAEAAKSLIESSKELILNALDDLADQTKGGQKLERSIRLSNNCQLSVSISGVVGADAEGNPALSVRATGTILAEWAAGGADATFSYSRDHNGEETLRLSACYLHGPKVRAEGLVDVKARAGVCATYKEVTGADAALQLDLVGKAGASIRLSENWKWGHEFETRQTIVKITLPQGSLP